MIWGIIDIQLDDIKTGRKIVFAISIHVNYSNSNNITKNFSRACLCITDIVMDSLAEILIIITKIIILNNMNVKDDELGYYKRHDIFY